MRLLRHLDKRSEEALDAAMAIAQHAKRMREIGRGRGPDSYRHTFSLVGCCFQNRDRQGAARVRSLSFAVPFSQFQNENWTPSCSARPPPTPFTPLPLVVTLVMWPKLPLVKLPLGFENWGVLVMFNASPRSSSV